MEYSSEDIYKVYSKHWNLKLAANELGIKWQTLYWNLKKHGYDVVGNKKKYGSITDKLAVKSEEVFNSLIPHANNLNKSKFQSKIDFKIREHLVDIMSSTKKVQNGYRKNESRYLRWSFGITEHQLSCDFIVCFCYEGRDAENHGKVERILLIPNEFFSRHQIISVSCNQSKWYEFTVTEKDLAEFFT